jgi:hypothetical protein
MLTHVFLAQQEETGTSPMALLDGAVARLDILAHPQRLLEVLDGMHLVWASVFVAVGALCVFNGYRWHKIVIVLCAFLAGLGLGRLLSSQVGESRLVMGAVGLLCAVVATPLLRITVAIFGGLTGAFIGANAWTSLAGTPDVHMAGAGMGFIAMALATFIMFKLVIVVFTSIGGAAMAVLGGASLLLHVPAWEPQVREALTRNQMVLPVLVGTTAVVGFVLQHHEIRRNEAKKHRAHPAPAAA